jgi:Xaa-Pro aminopeptidase
LLPPYYAEHTALKSSRESVVINGDPLILRLRAVKSSAEIAVIKYAYQVADAGMRMALQVIAPGVREREVGAEAEYTMRRMGSEGMGIDTIVAAGGDHTRAILAPTTQASISARNHVLVTLAPRYEGYHGAIGRVAAVGSVRPEIEEAVSVAIRAQDAAVAALKPGAIGADTDRAAREVCSSAGLENLFAYSGVHSVGVAEFEPPILTSWCREKIAADMVFSVDIPMFFATWGGLRIEDGFLIGKDGAEPLQTLPREMHRSG